MVLIRGLLAALLALWSGAGAASADADRLEAAWRDWVARTGVGASSIAIVEDREVVRQLAVGMNPEDRAPLASLSKSIVGACILDLEARGLLDRDQTVGEIFRGGSLQIDPGAAEITVTELLTHTSGIDVDSTQGRPLPWRASGGDRTIAVTQAALARPPGEKRFFYNNENYAVLGSIIIATTGRTAADLCPRLLDIDAAVSETYGGGVPWGGFEMSAPEFARFAAGLRPRADWPIAPMGGGLNYGPGVMLATPEQGLIWHFGSWCFVIGRSTGAYFFQLDDGWGATVTYNRCLSDAETRALDAALAAAVID